MTTSIRDPNSPRETAEDAPRRGRPPKVHTDDQGIEMAEPEAIGRKRPTTREEYRAARYGMDGSQGVVGSRLAVPAHLLDHDKFHYRWINDSPARILVKVQREFWDIVKADGNVVEGADLGDAVSHVVGTEANGSPLRSYLCRKPRSFYDEDQAVKSAELDRQMADLRRGNSRDGGAQADYIPAGGINIGR